ncbi:DUF1758 domain-containing protein [Nephila pilipes]|uniref:DUF1758 domain-containing protein n=1 Tax=Nephila pilipes TaxID=299642 RepID=A0A8X6UEK6_NEPPI|nr:DUF1758 domain-containing protein [Nephila pilipes]
MAIFHLQERFGREDLLLQIHVRDLMSMVMKNALIGCSKADFPTLYDELKAENRALQSLGRTQEKFGDFLNLLEESCLPEKVLVAWERSTNHCGKFPLCHTGPSYASQDCPDLTHENVKLDAAKYGAVHTPSKLRCNAYPSPNSSRTPGVRIPHFGRHCSIEIGVNSSDEATKQRSSPWYLLV